ncbi:fungal-specific transcription factor domain-containing protein [Mycena capillaripes]|nr:fungal-specific transcription factor domain-containing protein [Mycena capillaripes]
MPGNRCSNCIAFQSECTHSGRAKTGSSSTSTENIINNSPRTAQDHITSILSGSNEYISSDPLVVYQILVAVAQYARRLEEALAMTAVAQSISVQPSSPSVSSAPNTNSDETDTESDDGVLVDFALPEALRQITRDFASNRFYGSSSSILFVKSVMDAKLEATGDNLANIQSFQRPEFWNVRPWELVAEIFVPQLFPELQLMNALIDRFFSEINILIYVLHEIQFRRDVAAGLHLHDRKFGAVVLAVCALGAKYSDDPRVFLEGSNSEHSAGWKWFRQVRPIPSSFFASPSLYEIQIICLSILYLASASMPEQCWTLVGVGLRMAYDVGAHRRIRTNHAEDIVEAELYKRVFWILLCSDMLVSLQLGRPRGTAIQELDIDLPMPLEGEGPIVIVYSSLLLNLMEIWGRVQDDIYPIKRKDQNYQAIVAELDSALNQWADSVPQQLRWDPNQPDVTLLNQSACLYAVYYHVQILLHRPFIPSPGTHPSLSSHQISFPSLAISANAARSCAHVMDVQSKRAAGPLYNPHIISCMFDCAIVLLMNVYQRSRPTADQSVQKCLDVLRVYERRWHIAGRNADIIVGMLNMEEPSAIPPSLKRARSLEETPSMTEEPLHFPDLDRVAADIEQLQISEIERLLFLPLHTEDLGRLPVYEPFDFDSIFHSNMFLPTVNPCADALEAPLPESHFTDEPFDNNWDWNTCVPSGSN